MLTGEDVAFSYSNMTYMSVFESRSTPTKRTFTIRATEEGLYRVMFQRCSPGTEATFVSFQVCALGSLIVVKNTSHALVVAVSAWLDYDEPRAGLPVYRRIPLAGHVPARCSHLCWAQRGVGGALAEAP
jgi:hypothetical protein